MVTEASSSTRGAAFLLRRIPPEQKGCIVDLDHKTSEDHAVWTEDSLGYAREHDQRKVVW
jgi:hypothetical protein